MKTDKLKYAFAFILLLCAFLCGINFKRWYTANHRIERIISLMYSSSPYYDCYGNFEELLRQEFRKQGIEPIFDKFYLDFNTVAPEEGIKNMEAYLEIIKDKPVALILTVGDQAASALFTTRHRLLSSVPVVACNVHFPDEKLIKEYERRKVYVLRDAPDFQRNIDFIKSLRPQVGIDVIYNIDLTPLGRKSFDLLTRFADRKEMRLLGCGSAFSAEPEYKELQEMVEHYNLMPARAGSHVGKDEITISLCPFRYTKGTSLLVDMEKSKSGQEKEVFLLDKFDQMSLPITKALNIPSFSCIRQGFGEDAKIVGGYMATDEISARTAADFSVRLMNKEKIGMPKIRDMEKEYVLDWTYFSAYADFDVENVPEDVRIINYSFYDRYRNELYFLTGLFILAFILVLVSWLRIRRRSREERKNLEMLEEIHKRLTLSMDGGRVALWDIQGDNIEFDENYTRLVGMEQRTFVRTDFLKYAYPDDVSLLNSLYETLHQSTDMHVRRVRFSFSEENYRWYELRCRSLKDAKGRIMLAGVMQDIQLQVEREEQLIQAKQMAENAELKQSFLNNMSHEIRTPLNAIVGFTNLLVGEGGDEIEPEEKKAMLEIINRNNELLLKLVNDVVEISRLDSGNLDLEIKEWNMTTVVKEIYMAYQALIKPSLQFHLVLDESLSLPVRIDRMRFIQVISNFLNNADKFTRSGSVTLGCSVDKEHRKVSVYVQDTGKGIDEKELMMIFDRFYKTDEFEQGSGLGLSICKVIIERLCGHIEVQSEVGKGSRFTVILSLMDII
ncbi:sensor histidine kinase [Bacteroides intestinalis]|jgi:signal transduction histidine kinase|uniref:histidine kinase n=1 Tax=Bacteroides intestinalis TaxID=329854 RepID=A0A412YB80_9BACE|nr:HAMP domain-containing sensor histidine kinase [Bacteroides intestinalis]RGV54699.1 sensor histidine kinase [Bacteroides intestinalis]RHA62846.1 sensor histidine kinase [Bacteroides intestinalis]